MDEVESPDIIKINTGHLRVVRPDRYSNLMIETEFAAKINYFSILVVNVELLIQLFVDVLLFTSTLHTARYYCTILYRECIFQVCISFY